MFRWRQTEWRIFWKWWHPMEMSENSLWKQGKWMCTHMYRHIRTCACTCTHTHTHTLTHILYLSLFPLYLCRFVFLSDLLYLSFSVSPIVWWPCVIDDPVWLMTLCDWWSCVIDDPVWLMTLCDWWSCVIDDPVWLVILRDWWSCVIDTTWQDVKIHLQTEFSLSLSLFCTQVLVLYSSNPSLILRYSQLNSVISFFFSFLNFRCVQVLMLPLLSLCFLSQLFFFFLLSSFFFLKAFFIGFLLWLCLIVSGFCTCFFL